MNKFVLFFVSVVYFTFLPLNAAIYKGQKMYLRECSHCHGSEQNFVVKQTVKEWNILMKDDGKILSDVHINNERAKETWDYFKSTKYRKKSKHLKEFLVEYAKDSDKIFASH